MFMTMFDTSKIVECIMRCILAGSMLCLMLCCSHVMLIIKVRSESKNISIKYKSCIVLGLLKGQFVWSSPVACRIFVACFTIGTILGVVDELRPQPKPKESWATRVCNWLKTRFNRQTNANEANDSSADDLSLLCWTIFCIINYGIVYIIICCRRYITIIVCLYIINNVLLSIITKVLSITTDISIKYQSRIVLGILVGQFVWFMYYGNGNRVSTELPLASYVFNH
ncbi:hypothetical protein MPSEU_000727100 [Mayamaea pseudoterrestris]|nr:hypothetical protein MPSEU_000727100 [Mayamaea pseudoterrestris]